MKRVFGTVEIVFDLLYLTAAFILALVLLLYSSGNYVRTLAGVMALVLAGGDAFHLIPRILVIKTGREEPLRKALGTGRQVTSITMTLFYLLLWQIGVLVFSPKDISGWSYSIYALTTIRILLCLLPQNKWQERYPPVTWGILRNIPFFPARCISGHFILFIKKYQLWPWSDVARYCSQLSVLFTGRIMGKQKSQNRHAHATKNLCLFMDVGNMSITLDANIAEIFTYTINERSIIMNDYKKLTNEVGAPVADNENSITAGPRGPVVMQDVWMMEKMAHFNREVIPERRMHAKGWGAYGKLTITHDISKYTKAKVLQPGAETELFIRFSTVAGERGAADCERDIRGVAVKFYTEEGNWDLVGNNTPTFFIRDVHNFSDLNRAVKRDPRTGRRSAQNNWDFWTLLPECFHQITIVMSDRGIPASFRNMHFFGEHTFSFYNANNERVWCKFHFRTQQGIKNLSNEEAAKINGMDREYHGKDLYDAIERGNFPKWTMYVQIMTEEQAKNHYENPFDITKIWRHAEYPLIEVGILELNRNPENYFAEVEQAAFTPAHVVPGIGFSPDRFLQGRLFSYGDAQRYRLGVNHNLIPVNRAKVEVNDYHRDGAMRVDGNYGGAPAYTPNSYGAWTAQPEVMEPPLDLEGAMYRYDPKDDPTDDCFRAGGDLWRVLTEDKKQILIENTVADMASVTENIKYRHAVHCYLADPEYGERFTKAAGLNMDKVKELSELDHSGLVQATLSM